jgi:hypothetical protein
LAHCNQLGLSDPDLANHDVKGKELRAPKGKELRAPKGKELRAPKGKELRAPKGKELRAPKGKELRAPVSYILMQNAALASHAKSTALGAEFSLSR